MTITAATFRTDFPEFADEIAYSDQAIAYWSAFQAQFMNTDRWGAGATTASAPPTTTYDFGLELAVAHYLVLQKQAADSAATGAAPGVSQGPVSSKSVAGVSVSYDTQAALEGGAGHWNLTNYGTRYARLALQIGAGPIQIGGSMILNPLDGQPYAGPSWSLTGTTG
jgi:Protein of unknown function (DUF4054)